MRKLKILFLAATVIGFFSLVGCSKSNNSTPASTSDSVYSSGWLTLNMKFVGAPDSAYEQTFTNSAISQAVVDYGVVLSYIGFVNNGDTTSEQALEFDVLTSITQGSITIASSVYGYGDLSTNLQGTFYRYVIIPGSILATTKLTPKELKSMSYTEVTSLLKSSAKQSSGSLQ